MHATPGVPASVWRHCHYFRRRELGGVLMRVASGGPETPMPKTPEIVQPRSVSQGAQRVRKRRDNLVPLLEQLAYNLRWSWDPKTRALFQALGPEPWSRTHNPIAVLKSAANDPDRLAEHAESIVERSGDLDTYLHHDTRLPG